MGRPISPRKIGGPTAGRIRCTAHRFASASEATTAAWITKQVATKKFKVTDGTTTETLTLANTSIGALVAGTFTIEGVLDDSTRVQVTKLRNRTVQYEDSTNVSYTIGGTDPADHSTSDSLLSIESQ
jgi:hypothetical protein